MTPDIDNMLTTHFNECAGEGHSVWVLTTADGRRIETRSGKTQWVSSRSAKAALTNHCATVFTRWQSSVDQIRIWERLTDDSETRLERQYLLPRPMNAAQLSTYLVDSGIVRIVELWPSVAPMVERLT